MCILFELDSDNHIHYRRTIYLHGLLRIVHSFVLNMAKERGITIKWYIRCFSLYIQDTSK